MPLFNPQKAPTIEDDQSELANVVGWLENTIKDLAQDLQQNDLVELIKRYTSPTRPQAGNVVYADGTKWDPGSGEGLYFYDSAGVWQFVQKKSTLPSAASVFRAQLNTQHSTTNGVYTVVRFDTVTFDSGSWWDGTNFRYTPQRAGYYQVSWSGNVVNSAGWTSSRVSPFKNGARFAVGNIDANLDIGSDLVFLNGSTDYIDIRTQITSSSPIIGSTGNPESTYFTAHWVA